MLIRDDNGNEWRNGDRNHTSKIHISDCYPDANRNAHAQPAYDAHAQRQRGGSVGERCGRRGPPSLLSMPARRTRDDYPRHYT